MNKYEKEYIELLEGQLNQISIMSKIELGNDVIKEIKRLKKKIKDNVPFISEVEEFNNKFKKPNNYVPYIPDNQKESEFIYNFVLEEVEELKEAYESNDIVGVLDALLDLSYVGLGNGSMLFGLKDKIELGYAEVHASNMSKTCKTLDEAEETVKLRSIQQGEPCHYENVDDYYVVYRTRDKKAMKSINYFAPNLEQFFTKEELENSFKHKESDTII